MEGKYVSIDADYSSCNGYYNIKLLHLTIPFDQTLVLMVKLFIMVKCYVKEIISFQSISILVIMFTNVYI